jgi:hypothetical protein
MRKLAGIIVSLLFAIVINAQNTGRIGVEVKDEINSPLENATVELFRAKDSQLVKVNLTDKTGLAEFEGIAIGEYFIQAGMAGRSTSKSSIISITTETFNPGIQKLILSPSSKELAGVTIASKKPFIQKLTDRIVVNVDNSIVSAGSFALDVLERAPGVNIDQNDVISLRGRSGVIVMIDGKPTAMSGQDLANYLRSLPSSAIDRIDIITNPSAKYDAAGNSGIIDIRMKKDQRMGINGTLTAGYGQGIYSKANAGGTFNYRNKKINAFGNYNYGNRIGLNHLILDRNFFENGVYNGGDLKDNYSRSPFQSNSFRAGMDYFPSNKTIIGFVINSSFNHFKRNNDNSSIVIDPQHQPASTFISKATNNDHSNNVVANINFKHTFDSVGRELTVDVDYGRYNSHALSQNATGYFNLDGTKLQDDYVLNGDQTGELNFKTAKADYVNPLKNGARFEVGFKTSFVSSDNDAKFFDMSSGSPVNDINKTNHFIYKENNLAGYMNFSKEFKKFNIQLGLRGEQTNLETQQYIGNVKFDSSYFQLFPSAFFNYKLSEEKIIGLSVSRRIDRPGYGQLNPFLFLIDVTTYATGRPGLLPQLTWSYELSYTVKSLNLTLGYSHTKDNQDIAIARFRDAFPGIPSEDNVTVQIPINLESSDYFGLSVSSPIRISNWWNMINNADLYYNHYNGKLGITSLSNGRPAVDIRTNNSFTFKKGWSAEMNVNFNSGGQAGFMVLDPRWGVAAGVQKNVLKGKGTVRFNVTDIFWTNLPKAVITYDDYIEKWHAFRESRVANISFTYRFGNNKVQAARRRTTASEEERQRIN